jgi:hypothetical protein
MAWGWLASIFASQKAVEDVTATGKTIAEGLLQGANYLRFSDQERADYNLKGAAVMLEFWDKVREESSEQSKARRVLAVKIIDFFVNALAVAIMFRVGGVFAPSLIEVSNFIIDLTLSGIVGGLVISIGAIYFGPHQLSKIMDFRKK